LNSFQGDVTETSSNADTLWDGLAGKLELPLFLTSKEYASIYMEERTMEIIDDTVIVVSVSSPPEEDDEPEPEHALTESV
jgi:hypothetical protein